MFLTDNTWSDHGVLPLLKRSELICDDNGFCRYKQKNWHHLIWVGCLGLTLVGLVAWLVFTHCRRKRKMGGNYYSRYSEPLPKYTPTYSETRVARILVRAPEPAYTGACVPIPPPSYHSTPRGSEGLV